MGLFERLKKNKTLRSLLGAMALFSAGVPSAVEAAPKTPQKAAQSAVYDCNRLATEYAKVRPIFEGNTPYCYDDNGVVAGACGVRFKGFPCLSKLEAVKVTPKKGFVFSFKEYERSRYRRLFDMANANWDLPTTLSKFPEIENVEKIKLEDCCGEYPRPSDKFWSKSLILLPTKTMKEMNNYTADFFVQKACGYHPNLFQLPLTDQIVVVDVIYNLGHRGYAKQKSYPKFKKAIQNQDLTGIKEQCGTGNKRRDCMRQSLADIPLIAQKPNMTKPILIKKVKEAAVGRYSKIVGELDFWDKIAFFSGEAINSSKKVNVLKPVWMPSQIQKTGKPTKVVPKTQGKVKRFNAVSRPRFSKTKKIIPRKVWNKSGR